MYLQLNRKLHYMEGKLGKEKNMTRKITAIIITLENATEKEEQQVIEQMKNHPKIKEVRKLSLEY